MKKKAKKARGAAHKPPVVRSRSDAEKAADERALEAFEQGEFLAVSEVDQAAAVARLKERRAAREQAKSAARGLGEIRKGLGITQERLAGEIGVDKSDISRAESGRHVPSLERILVTVRAIQNLSGLSLAPAAPGSLLDAIYSGLGELESCLDSAPLKEVAS